MQGASNAAKQAIIPPLIEALRERALLEWIRCQYLALPEASKPPGGVWIRRYPPVPPGTDSVGDAVAFPHAVWFVDEHGLRRENVWKWRRFMTVQSEKPWCQRSWGEPNAILGRHFMIGLTAFAPYNEGSDFYAEVQWAGLFGHGWRVSVSDTGAIGKSEIWIS